MKMLLLVSLLLFCSCNTEYSLELQNIKKQEQTAHRVKYKSLTDEQYSIFVKMLYEEYIPERANVTFMDKNRFIYISLGKKYYALKVMGPITGKRWVTVYNLN